MNQNNEFTKFCTFCNKTIWEEMYFQCNSCKRYFVCDACERIGKFNLFHFEKKHKLLNFPIVEQKKQSK